MDPRDQKLAEKLVNYSVSVQPGDNVMIQVPDDVSTPLVIEVIKEVYKAGGNPFVNLENAQIQRALLMDARKEQLEIMMNSQYEMLKKMDCYIAIRGFRNALELSDVPEEKSRMHTQVMDEMNKFRVTKLRWVIVRYPGPAIAQLARMSEEKYEDFLYQVCTMDYQRMSDNMDYLVKRMEKADQVHIIGKGTDLRFSIKGIPAIKCDGKLNMPDGEVFTSPVRDSVNGHVTYNIPSIFRGKTFEQIYFEFENGKIVKATCNYEEELNAILDTDEGSRYLGEFAFERNPFVTEVTCDGSIDEKMTGSIHITPGDSGKQSDNGNHSSIHWDIVLCQTPEYGGGEIWFDGELIRKDGLFVPEDLRGLNP